MFCFEQIIRITAIRHIITVAVLCYAMLCSLWREYKSSLHYIACCFSMLRPDGYNIDWLRCLYQKCKTDKRNNDENWMITQPSQLYESIWICKPNINRLLSHIQNCVIFYLYYCFILLWQLRCFMIYDKC